MRAADGVEPVGEVMPLVGYSPMWLLLGLALLAAIVAYALLVGAITRRRRETAPAPEPVEPVDLEALRARKNCRLVRMQTLRQAQELLDHQIRMSQEIAGMLGKHRGGSNGERKLVAFDQYRLGQVKFPQYQGIDQQVLGRHGQPLKSPQHRQTRSSQDVQAVNFLVVSKPDAPVQGFVFYDIEPA